MEYEIITNTINNITNKFNIIFPVDSTNMIYEYLKIVLNVVRQPNVIPISWLDERKDLIERINKANLELEQNESSYVKGDSFGDGMPRGQSDPNSQEKKYLTRIELKEEIIPSLENRLDKVNLKIAAVEREFDTNVKDYINDIIDLIPNESHKDIMKQFYIYRKSYAKISQDSYLSIETVKSYRKRGFKTLTEILLNYANNYHKM